MCDERGNIVGEMLQEMLYTMLVDMLDTKLNSEMLDKDKASTTYNIPTNQPTYIHA
jgi:hypothetical protein